MEVVGDGVGVDLGDAAFLGPDRAREVAEVIDGQRQVGGQGLADRLAVLPALGDRKHLEVGLDPVGDLVQDDGPLGGRGAAPGGLGAVRGVQRQVDVLGGAAGDLGERLAGDRRRVLEVFAGGRRHAFAADVVVVLGVRRTPRCRRCPVLHTWSLEKSSSIVDESRLHAREADVAVTLQCGFYGRIIGEVNLRGDPAADAVLLGRVHDAVLAGERCPVGPRTLISDSWRRSLAAHVDPDHDEPPVVYDHDTLEAIRSTHPLGEVLSLLRAILVSIADEAEHMMIVTDADGHILWREGKADVCLRADRVLLTEGTKWSESAIGTNAMGTALALGRPVQIHSAEHLVRTYHGWTCAAAPVADPDSGSVVGAIDVTGPQHTRHPATLALVTAAAQLAQGQLWARMTARDELLLRHNIAHLRGPGALLSASGRVIATESCGRLPPRVDITAPDRLVILPDGREATVEPLAAGFLLRMAGRQCTRTPTLSLAFLGATHPVAVLDGRTLRWRMMLLGFA